MGPETVACPLLADIMGRARAQYRQSMAGDERPTLEELSQLSPNERVELARAGVVRQWEQLDAAEQAHIQAVVRSLREE